MNPELARSFECMIASLPSPQSRVGYRVDWDRYLVYLSLQKLEPTAAKPRDVIAFCAHLRDTKSKRGKPFAKSTIGRNLSVVREVYSAFVRDELMPANPAREVKPPRM